MQTIDSSIYLANYVQEKGVHLHVKTLYRLWLNLIVLETESEEKNDIE